MHTPQGSIQKAVVQRDGKWWGLNFIDFLQLELMAMKVRKKYM
jgi:hypothetical protein